MFVETKMHVIFMYIRISMYITWIGLLTYFIRF